VLIPAPVWITICFAAEIHSASWTTLLPTSSLLSNFWNVVNYYYTEKYYCKNTTYNVYDRRIILMFMKMLNVFFF
jgi:hypothetical protein